MARLWHRLGSPAYTVLGYWTAPGVKLWPTLGPCNPKNTHRTLQENPIPPDSAKHQREHSRTMSTYTSSEYRTDCRELAESILEECIEANPEATPDELREAYRSLWGPSIVTIRHLYMAGSASRRVFL